jgi:hypothetical protein
MTSGMIIVIGMKTAVKYFEVVSWHLLGGTEARDDKNE